MAVIALNGASSPAHSTHSLYTEVEHQLAAQFETVRTFHLAGDDIGHCMGEFDRFENASGRYRIHVEGKEIEQA